jgi:two-component sensor histidine kinase
MSEALWVLQVEDSESDAALVHRHLEKAGYDVYSERVQDAGRMRAALARASWDVIVCDYHVPQFEAPEALAILRESHQDIPFIVVSGVAGEDLAVAMMRLGAQDYLLKDRLARLGPAVDRELREAGMRLLARQGEKELLQSEERNRTQQVALDRQTRSLVHTESLLREIHHRVKNNLQVVSSLLGLQSRAAVSEETRKLLQDLCNRVHSMALLHETLYDTNNPALVDFRKYIEQLTAYLLSSYGIRSEQIRLHSDLDSLWLDLDVALPCGLIVNEALGNSLEHAFADGRTGEVRIALKEEPGGSVALSLADDGIGLAPGLEPAASRSLGFRLMHMLARQLNAKLDIQSRYGTEIRLTFAAAVQAKPSDYDSAVTEPRPSLTEPRP